MPEAVIISVVDVDDTLILLAERLWLSVDQKNL